MTGGVHAQYQERLDLGEIEPDSAQLGAVRRLDRLSKELAEFSPPQEGFLSGLFGRRSNPPRGLYFFGGVGRGKTMLMDLFFETLTFLPRRRVHFHEFMVEVHERIARGRSTTDGDPIPFVAAEIAGEAGLLCFDELHVTDIADAMILARLFKVLFERQVVVVATSNEPPSRLYWNGLNRELFLPFTALLESRLDIMELAAAKDFRLDKLSGRQLYFSPCDGVAEAALDEHWERLTGHHPAAETELEVKGRKVRVPKAAMGVARFAFADLCESPLGAHDYLRIAHAYHTVLIDGIPILTPELRNVARRLVTLVDMLYDNRVCLIASAAAEPHLLYPHGDGAGLFERTASRLMEMRSEAYLEKRAAGERSP
jgi:cell division protein ZapE